VEVRFERGADDVPVFANPLLIREIFENLLDNAVEYECKDGHVTVYVISDGDARGPRLRMKVKASRRQRASR